MRPLSPPSEASGFKVSFKRIGCLAGILAASIRVAETRFKSSPSLTATTTASFIASKAAISASLRGSTSTTEVFS